MSYYFRPIIFTIFVISLVVQGLNDNFSYDLSLHIEAYSEMNETHHDNIATEEHSHVHRHSENGDEHEHHHDHSNVFQQSIKLITPLVFKAFHMAYEKLLNYYSYKSMFSTEHPLSVFRPPIA